MRIATFNVNGIKARLPRLLEWLDQTRPDVVCLQEIKTGDATFPAQPIREAGYEVIWHGQPTHHGVAVLVRGTLPKERRRGLPGDPLDLQARYLEVEVGEMIVSSVYLPNGNPRPGPKFDYKLAWFDRLISHAQQLLEEGRPCILAGDLNVIPTDFDIYDPLAWAEDAVMQPESREAFYRLLQQGWVDAARRLHPSDRQYTFWANAFAFRRRAGFRLDFLLLSPSLTARLQRCEVDAFMRGLERSSDHVPLWVELSS